jgi:heparan-alpha-glucosaminide N-acetyltransferase
MAAPEAAPAARLTSLDAFRGFTMLLMASEIARLPRALLQTHPGNGLAFFVADVLEHREWVGVTPPFSLASRRARGDAFGTLFRHALWRSLLLVALGIFLRSQGRPQTYFTFEDVLTQIGLGYPILFLLAWTKPRWQAVAAAAIAIGYWAAFALYPLPASTGRRSACRSTGRITCPASPRTGTRTPTWPRPRTCGSSTCSRARRRSASTAAVT